jgi:hypothetical protein
MYRLAWRCKQSKWYPYLAGHAHVPRRRKEREMNFFKNKLRIFITFREMNFSNDKLRIFIIFRAI